jgi:hypothetical protein
LGQVEKDCRKVAPKEERVGKTCESNERERTSQIGKPKSIGLIRYANAGSVVEKKLASPLADAFSQHIPAWRPSATPYLSKKSLSTAQAQGYLRSKMSNGVSQSHASSLAKGFESTEPVWLAQA